MSRTMWTWSRLVGGAAILAVLLWRLGTGPFLDGVRAIDGWSLAAAGGIALVTTVCSAWRWRLVAGGLGVRVPLASAVAAYYRSQFLNTTLPGGVLGDVHRGVRHGRDVGDVGLGLRAVGWERSAGQVVQVVLAVLLLLILPSPVRSSMPAVAAVVVAAVLCAVLLTRILPRRSRFRAAPTWFALAARTAATDIRDGLLAQRAWPGILLASTVVVAGHTATFIVAARTAGTPATAVELLPLALLALLAMSVPLNIGGWGPREGVAAWAFAAAGFGAAQGVGAAVVYGVMALVATLPGLVVLIAVGPHRRTPCQSPEDSATMPAPQGLPSPAGPSPAWPSPAGPSPAGPAPQSPAQLIPCPPGPAERGSPGSRNPAGVIPEGVIPEGVIPEGIILEGIIPEGAHV